MRTFSAAHKSITQYKVKHDVRIYVAISRRKCTYSLCFGLSSIPFVVLRIHQFSEYLSGMAAGIEMISMRKSLAFATLFSTMSGKNMLIVIVVEMFVFVNVVVRHSSRFSNTLKKITISVDAVEQSLPLRLTASYGTPLIATAYIG